MSNIIYLTQSESLLARIVRENIDLLAEGNINWDNIRDYAIQCCAEHNLHQKAAIRHACQANSVDRTHYYRAHIAQKRFFLTIDA